VRADKTRSFRVPGTAADGGLLLLPDQTIVIVSQTSHLLLHQVPPLRLLSAAHFPYGITCLVPLRVRLTSAYRVSRTELNAHFHVRTSLPPRRYAAVLCLLYLCRAAFRIFVH